MIIPTYNRAHTLKRALDSVLQQSLAAHEIIVVDDGSDDESETLFKNYCNQHMHMHYLTMEHGGVSHARNIGIQRSKSEWLAFLDSDDEVA